jgi:hypothetical protein
MFWAFHNIFNLISEQIFVLFSETEHRVINLLGSMFYSKESGRKIKIGGREILLFFMVVSEFGDERWLVGGGNRAPFIKEIEDTQRIIIDKFDDFEVVWKLNLTILINQAFLLEDLLFLLEDFLQINLMQSFICVVNEKLFQTVWFENFESVNVQKTQVYCLFLLLFVWTFIRRRKNVQLLNDPLEQLFVQAFCQWVNQFLHLSRSEILCHHLCSYFDMIWCQSWCKLFLINWKQLRNLMEKLCWNDFAKLIVFMIIQIRLQIPQM